MVADSSRKIFLALTLHISIISEQLCSQFHGTSSKTHFHAVHAIAESHLFSPLPAQWSFSMALVGRAASHPSHSPDSRKTGDAIYIDKGAGHVMPLRCILGYRSWFSSRFKDTYTKLYNFLIFAGSVTSILNSATFTVLLR